MIAIEDTVFEVIIKWIITFLIGVLSKIFGLFFSFFLAYVAFYLIANYAVCGNDREEYEKFVGYIRSGIKDLAKAFMTMTPGVYESAKMWTEEKMQDIKERREKKGRM